MTREWLAPILKTLDVGAMSDDDPFPDLLLACADYDRAAFRLLYRDSSAKLMGSFCEFLKQRTEAEDALQETSTRVWLCASCYVPSKGRGMLWLIAFARNHAIDRLRVHATSDEGIDLVADATPRAETRLVAMGEVRRMANCFDTLEPHRAEAVRSAYLGGVCYTDGATRDGVPLNTM